MKNQVSLLGWLGAFVAALVADPARADFEPPVIEIVEAETFRAVHADVSWTDPIHGPLQRMDNDNHQGGGPWLSRTVFAQGPLLTAAASQKSYTDRFSIHGEGHTEAESAVEQHAEAFSSVQLTFELPVEATFSFKAAFLFDDVFGNGFHASDFTGLVIFPTLPPAAGACGGATNIDFDDPETWEFECVGTALPGIGITFVLLVATSHTGEMWGKTEASVEFDLNFGDRDRDDLLDVWEEEGIDLGECGRIPLHESELDADPDIKDLYVEVDTLAGAPYSQGDLNQLVQAFAEAPVSGSDDLEIHRGIRLHLIHSESGIPHPAIVGTTAQMEAHVGTLRRVHFGSPGDSAALRFAKQFVFRYAVVANFITDGDDLVFGTGDGAVAAGSALIVAAGSIQSNTVDEFCNGAPCWLGFEASLSGKFMHALGHTLALQHGGQDNVPLKPNYLSVMNTNYEFPWNIVTDQGTNVSQYWDLDYGQGALALLDEEALVEQEGLSGAEGRVTLFTSTTTPECMAGMCRAIANADGSPIDWSLDGLIDEESVQSDLNRSDVLAPLHYGVLGGHSDWDQLRYGPGLWHGPPTTCSPPGDLGQDPDFAEEISLPEVQTFHQGDWFDLTDVVYSNLSVSKSNGETFVTAGASTTYAVIVGNAGPSDVFGATVSDLLPPELTCSWTCVPSAGAVCTSGPVAGDLVDVVDLPAGSGLTYTVECLVDPDATGSVTNRATVTPPPSVADTDPTDNVAIDTDNIYGSCGYPDSVVLDHQVIDTSVEVIACTLVTLGDQLEVVVPGQLVVGTAGRVVIHSGFQVGSGAELRVGGLPPP